MAIAFKASPTITAVVAVISLLPILAWASRRSRKPPTATIRARRLKPKSHDPDIPVDSVLYSSHSCDDEYDVIVIGSGIGGLTVASLLARQNFKVLVLEQHYVAGGLCQTFESGGYRFGTGIHYVGGVNLGLTKSVLQSITYEDDPIQWDQLSNNFDTLILGTTAAESKRYDIVGGGWDSQKQRLKEQFPCEDHAAIDKYYDLLRRVNASGESMYVLKSLPRHVTKVLRWTGLYKLFDGGFHKYASMSVLDTVSTITDNKVLQAVMCYNWGDYGCEPKKAPFALQAFVTAHYRYGAFYPRGGPGTIARKIIPTITDAGGSVLVNATVEKITFNDDGHAAGVEMEDGRNIRAKRAVISDAGLIDTVKHLLPTTLNCREKLVDSLFGPADSRDLHLNGRNHKLHASCSGMYTCVGLKGDHDRDLHLPHTQLWAFPSAEALLLNSSNGMSLEDAMQMQEKDVSVFISCPSGKDSAWKDEFPDKSSLEIIMTVPSAWFQRFAPDTSTNRGGQEYENLKKKLGELMWVKTVEALTFVGATNVPRTLDEVDHYQIATPLTWEHFLRREGGPFYGTENDMARYEATTLYENIRPDIPEIPGLYLTGQDAECCGFVGAMMGGLFCAAKVAGVSNPMSLLAE